MSTKCSFLLLALCVAACGMAHGLPHAESHRSSYGGHPDMAHLQGEADFPMPTLQSATVSRKLLQATTAAPAAPSVCTFTNGTAGESVSSCGPNRNLFLYLANTTNITTTGSARAVADLQIAASRAVCNAYNASSPEGADACVADTVHNCYLVLQTTTEKLLCRTFMAQTVQSSLACPDSIAYKYAVCMASNRTSCQADPDCIWSLFGAGPVYAMLANSSVAPYEEMWRNASLQLGGTHQPEYGFCQFRAQFDAATAESNGTAYDWTTRYNWEISTLYSNNAETFFYYNGNCSIAEGLFAASTYENSCFAFNSVPASTDPEVDMGIVLMRSDLPPNVTAVQGCIEAKCVMTLSYTSSFDPDYRPYTNYTGYFSCNSDLSLVYALLYDAETDGAVWKAQVECNLLDNQFDREACNAVHV